MAMTSDFPNADVFVDDAVVLAAVVLAAVDGLEVAEGREFEDERAFR